MGLFDSIFRRRHGEGTTIESPIVVENAEAMGNWVGRNYIKRGFIPNYVKRGFIPIADGEIPARKGYSGFQCTLENAKGETVTVYFKFGDVDLAVGTTIESPIVVESIAAEYDWIRENLRDSGR